MNYSKWLKGTFPQLENASSVKVFNYVKKAKKETKKARFFITLINIVALGLLGYIIGYVSSKFTDFSSNSFMDMALIAVVIVISLFISQKIEQRIIQKKLIELVGHSA